MGFFIN